MVRLNKSAISEEVSELNLERALAEIFEEIRYKYPLTEPSAYQKKKVTSKVHPLKAKTSEMGDLNNSISEDSTEIESPPLSPIISGVPTRKVRKTRVKYFEMVRFIIFRKFFTLNDD